MASCQLGVHARDPAPEGPAVRATILLLFLSASAASAKGPACSHDRHCPNFLRCEDGECAPPPAMAGTTKASTPRVVFSTGSGDRGFFVEVVDDPYERQRGLMYRNHMANGWGMLFVYNYERDHQFWMRNTYIALDLVFLGADGKVRGVVHDMQPLDERGKGLGLPSRDVLEVPAGTARRLGIEAGIGYRYINLRASRAAPIPAPPAAESLPPRGRAR